MVLIVWASYSIPFSPGASKQALKTLQGDLVRKRTYKNTLIRLYIATLTLL